MNKILTTFLIATTMLVSCTNDKDNVVDENGAPMKISIRLKGAQAATKTVDANPVDEDNVINDFIVFAVRSDGAFDVPPAEFTAADLSGGTTVPQITATTKAVSVFIITNTGAFSTGPFKNVADLAELSRVVASVNGNPNAGSHCKSGNVWMEGNSLLQAAGVDGDGIALRTATVNLGYIAAKVHVIVKNQMTNYDSGNVILDGVSVINGGTWTRFTVEEGSYKPARADLPAQPFFYNGITINPANYADQPAAGDYTVNALYKWAPVSFFPMLPSVSIPVTATPTATEGFYLFPTITANKTYVTVYGRYKTGGGANTLTDPNYFWAFAFGGVDGLAEAIASGQKCIVTITLKGNANTGGGGETDPTEEAAKAFVDITIQTAEWIPVIVDKVIQ